jgi:hypothetical protein
MPVRAGNRVAVFGRRTGETAAREKLSIVMPVYNEARYAAEVIDAVLAKPLKIDRELIIVESNSTDGTRAIVQSYQGRPGVRVVLEDRPRGKGHAVRTGLATSRAPSCSSRTPTSSTTSTTTTRSSAVAPAPGHLRARLAQPRPRRLEGP